MSQPNASTAELDQLAEPTFSVTVELDLQPCGRCKRPTNIRCETRPYHALCALRDGVTRPVPSAEPRPLRLLADLETRHMPMRTVDGRRGAQQPYWRAPMPGMLEQLVVPGWTWRREHTGPVTVLDRNAGFLLVGGFGL